MFSGDRKIPTRGPKAQVGNKACRVSHWNVGPEGWDFSGTTEHKWSILFLIYHDRTVQYCVISVDDVTEVDVYSQWRALYKQLETANKQRIKQWKKWILHQNGYTRTSLSATVTRVSNFAENNVCACFFYIVKAPPVDSVTHFPTQQVKYINRNALSMFKALNKSCK